ncbi:MAG: NAD(P)-dependent oxidoreductase [Chloroflexota bacterium]|nr:NAD(P)-dependent oxidoreductase [Chloroflexota bacterium]
MTNQKIGFIGLGRMGLPMAYNLLKAGLDLTVHNRSRPKVQDIAAAGATAAISSAEVTRQCDIVLACLPDIATSEEVFLGPDGVMANARPGQIIVDHSTVGIDTSKACAGAADTKGAMFLDAPISGGTERAENATLVIMAGGPEEAFAAALPAFDAMGGTVRHTGPTGTGTTVKLVNQLLVGVHTLAAAEAMLMGTKSGADPALVYELVSSGWGQSFMLDRNSSVMLDQTYEDARAPVRTILKDLGLIQELARSIDTPTPAGDVAYKLFAQAAEAGLGDLDMPGVARLLEKEAGVEIRRKS